MKGYQWMKMTSWVIFYRLPWPYLELLAALCWVSSPLGFLQGGSSGQKYVHKHKKSKQSNLRIHHINAKIQTLGELKSEEQLSDSSLDSHLLPGLGGIFPSRLSLIKTFFLSSQKVGWDFCFPQYFPSSRPSFFLFQEVKADKFWKGLEVPSLHQWSCQYQPPIAQSHQVCLIITLLIAVTRTTFINNQYNPLQEILCLKSTTLLSMKMKKRRRHISICTGFGSSTRHIFQLALPTPVPREILAFPRISYAWTCFLGFAVTVLVGRW